LGHHPPPHPPRQLHEALTSLFEVRPETADWPVHLLDMEPDDAPESPLDGLLTTVETDVMTDEQGPVVALTAWWRYPQWKARTDALASLTPSPAKETP